MQLQAKAKVGASHDGQGYVGQDRKGSQHVKSEAESYSHQRRHELLSRRLSSVDLGPGRRVGYQKSDGVWYCSTA